MAEMPDDLTAAYMMGRADAAEEIRRLRGLVEELANHMDEGVRVNEDPETGEGWPASSWDHDAISLVSRARRALNPEGETHAD